MDSSNNSKEFKKFLEKITNRNSTAADGKALDKIETLLKGENADKVKSAKELENINASLIKIREKFVNLENLLPVEQIASNSGIENLVEVQKKALEELSLIRKLTEGSLEYDKESAQYRNTSGRELVSDVTGKDIKKGGYIDFETATNRLTGQSKRVRESERNQLQLKPVETFVRKIAPISVSRPDRLPYPRARPRAQEEEITGLGNLGDLGRAIKNRFKDVYNFVTNKNVKQPETELDANKPTSVPGTDLDAKKSSLGSLGNLGKAIKNRFKDSYNFVADKDVNQENLTDKGNKTSTGSNELSEDDNYITPAEAVADTVKLDLEISKEQKTLLEEQLKELRLIREALAPKTPAELDPGITRAKEREEKSAEEGGGISLGDIPGRGIGGKIIQGAKNVGRGAVSLGGKFLKFAGSKGGMIAGSALAIGTGAYTAYKGYTGASEEQQAKQQEIDARVQAGEITPQEAEEQKKQLGEATVEKKGGAIGEGTGMAAGAIGGMKAGALVGATIGSAVPVVGTAIGAGVGTIAGGALGAFAGSKIGKKAGEFGGRLWTGIKNAPKAISDYNEKFKEVDNARGNQTAAAMDVPGAVESDYTSNVGSAAATTAPRLDMESAASVSPRRTSSTGADMMRESTENSDLQRGASMMPGSSPIVSNNVVTNNSTSFVPIKPTPRPEYTGSALDRYQNKVAVY